jgi:NadR type nicotinamide-nucleotide adenylyltransferase
MEETNFKINKIAIIGAESTGKTVLCEQLSNHYNTIFVPEFAREYFNTHDINNYSLNDLEYIAKQQHQLEKEYLKNTNRFLFFDTTLITIKIWAKYRFNKIPTYFLNNINSSNFDYYLLLNNDVEWVKDTQRKDENIRELLFELNKNELDELKIKYGIVSGIGDDRLDCAIHLINSNF